MDLDQLVEQVVFQQSANRRTELQEGLVKQVDSAKVVHLDQAIHQVQDPISTTN